MPTNLEKLLAEKRQHSEDQRLSHEAEKEEWLGQISRLYGQIEEWIKPLKEKRYLSTSPFQVVLDEELFGKYETLGLKIEFYNGASIEIVPVARYIPNGKGRLDLNLRNRVLKIVGREDGTGWELAAPMGVILERRPFNRESFEELLESFVSRF